MLLFIIIVLISGFAYDFFAINYSTNMEQSIQLVFADNIGCNSNSTCTTDASQSAVIGGGDENRISQDLSLENNNCTNSSQCD